MKAGKKISYGNRMEGIALSSYAAVFFGSGGTVYLVNDYAPPEERRFKLNPEEAKFLSEVLYKYYREKSEKAKEAQK